MSTYNPVNILKRKIVYKFLINTPLNFYKYLIALFNQVDKRNFRRLAHKTNQHVV